MPIPLLLALAVALVGAPLPAAPADLVTAEAATRPVTLTGFTRARARLPLVTETGGRIVEVRADVGDPIPEDGVFAVADDTFVRLELEANRAEQARLRDRIAYDETEAERYRALAARGDAPRSTLDAALQTLRDNRHALRALEIAEERLAERLARTRVRAPPGWRVTDRRVEPLQWTAAGDRLGAAGDFSRLVVPFALTPAEQSALEGRAGALRLRLPARGGEVPARVHRVNPAFDPETRKTAVELILAAPLEEPRGGLRAELTLHLPDPSGAVLLPPGAVTRSYEEHWVTRADGERVRVVRLGQAADGRLRVTGPGIAPGDRFRLEAP